MARPEKVAVVDEIRDEARRGRRRGAHRVPRPDRDRARRAARRAAPGGTDYKVFKNTLARRAAEDAGLDRARPDCSRARSRSPSCPGDAVTAAKALRDFARTNPNLVVKGGLLGPAAADAGRRRGARRRPAPRGAARPARRWVPGADGQGRRPVPGLHPQLRLRPQGAASTSGSRAAKPAAGPSPEADAPSRRSRAPKRAESAPEATAEAEPAAEAAARRSRRRRETPADDAPRRRPTTAPSRVRTRHRDSEQRGEAHRWQR